MSTPVAGAPSTTSSISPMRAYSKWQQKYYPLELWWAIASFIALVSFFHIVSLSLNRYEKRSARESLRILGNGVDEKGSIRPGDLSNLNERPRALRNIPSAALNSAQTLLFRIRLPFHQLHRMNVAEMAISVGYLIALLTWGFVNSRGLAVGLWANRAAHLATSQTPLIVILASRNNVVTLLTGISYEKLNVLHRASARSTLILIWVHALGRWRLGLRGHFSMDRAEMRFGAVSLVAFTFVILLSVRPIRNFAYEAFLISHIILVLMYLIFGLLHVPEAKYRFWPALGIWALDRSLRLLRIIVLNKLWINIFPFGNKVDEAGLERVSSDTIRLTVHRSFKWRSGQHAYILAPSIAKLPFEAHPFTIASIYSKEAHQGCRSQELVFIIRGRDGFTKRLLEASKLHQTIPVVIDGPYGAPLCLSHFSTCIFLAGGSGVSYTLPLLLNLVREVQSGNAVTQRALFVWVVHELSHIGWISNLLEEAVQGCLATLQLSINIHLTRQDPPQLVSTKQSHDGEPIFSLTSFQAVNLFAGRPNIGLILEEELNCTNGRMSIDVCGPSALANATRDALVTCNRAKPDAVLRGVPRTTLHVEGFGW